MTALSDLHRPIIGWLHCPHEYEDPEARTLWPDGAEACSLGCVRVYTGGYTVLDEQRQPVHPTPSPLPEDPARFYFHYDYKVPLAVCVHCVVGPSGCDLPSALMPEDAAEQRLIAEVEWQDQSSGGWLWGAYHRAYPCPTLLAVGVPASRAAEALDRLLSARPTAGGATDARA